MQKQTTFRIALNDPPRLLSVNENVAALLGFSTKGFLSGRVTLQDQIHEEGADSAGNVFSPNGEERSGAVNLSIPGASGQIRCIRGQCAKTPNCTHNGTILPLDLRDVREIQEPADQLHSDSYAALPAKSQDCVYVKYRNHVLLAGGRPLGEVRVRIDDRADLLGKADYGLHHEQEAGRYYRPERLLFREGLCVDKVQQVLARDGTKHRVDKHKYFGKFPNGEILRLFGIAPDITPNLGSRAEAERKRGIAA